MPPDEKNELTEESFADDPLVQRVYKRTQPELRREAWQDAFLNSKGQNSGAASAMFFVFATLWAIVSSIFEAIPYEWNRAKENRRRKREESSGIKQDPESY